MQHKVDSKRLLTSAIFFVGGEGRASREGGVTAESGGVHAGELE